MFSLSTVSPNDISNAVHIFTFTSEIQVCCWLNVRFLLIELRRRRITLKWLSEIVSGGSSGSISQLQCTFALRMPCQVFLFSPLADLLHTATCGPLRAALPAFVPAAWLIALDAAACPRRVGRPLRKKNTSQHVPNKFKRLWNSAGGRGQPIPLWQWWMAGTRNGKEIHGRCLFICSRTWQWRSFTRGQTPTGGVDSC